MSFSHTSYGKWIVAGEHAVLRGGKALVFPLFHKKLQFDWEDTGTELQVEFSGEQAAELKLIFFSLIEEAVKKLGISRSKLNGQITINSDLPLGTGLGASAAICVAITKWLEHLGFVKADQLFDFARELENLFHGESSGVDIAVSLAGAPILFQKDEGFKSFKPKWWPNWYLSYSGKRGATMECVKRVQSLFSTDPAKAKELDEKMRESVDEAVEALSLSEEDGLSLLRGAIQKAGACFEAWGLTEGVLQREITRLKETGAVAVKPTGSGGGGYILHLWPKGTTANVAKNIPLAP